MILQIFHHMEYLNEYQYFCKECFSIEPRLFWCGFRNTVFCMTTLLETVDLLLCSRIRPDHKAELSLHPSVFKAQVQKYKVREFWMTHKPFYPE